jgi:hypothetical protein
VHVAPRNDFPSKPLCIARGLRVASCTRHNQCVKNLLVRFATPRLILYPEDGEEDRVVCGGCGAFLAEENETPVSSGANENCRRLAKMVSIRCTRCRYRRSTCPSPSRYPCLRVSGMSSDAASPIATIAATYQANHGSWPDDLSHRATYSAVPPNIAFATA